MINISNYSFNQITGNLLGKNVHFKSDCEFFPNFDVTGKVVKVYMNNDETIIDIIEKCGKRLSIGSNMKNLRFEIV